MYLIISGIVTPTIMPITAELWAMAKAANNTASTVAIIANISKSFRIPLALVIGCAFFYFLAWLAVQVAPQCAHHPRMSPYTLFAFRFHFLSSSFGRLISKSVLVSYMACRLRSICCDSANKSNWILCRIKSQASE